MTVSGVASTVSMRSLLSTNRLPSFRVSLITTVHPHLGVQVGHLLAYGVPDEVQSAS